ncbi:hypothetical protein C1882_18130 [Pseudomonas sp. FW305-E2]|nr:hypothetical protein [Pseudomonas sp. FW305-E2]POA83667.1 hypothetical protein C1882_18130 [Pseudomonas sp. FW305-E2]
MINFILTLLGRHKRAKTIWDIREEQFILAVNSLKTLRATPEGIMRIDVSEIRDQVLASRERYKEFVRRSGH